MLSRRLRYRLGCRALAALLCSTPAAFAAAACKCTETPAAHEPARGGVTRGDRVVVEQAAAQFYEAQVLEVAADLLRVQTTNGQQSMTVAVGDAYRLPPPPAAYQPGQYVICSHQPQRWTACRFERMHGELVVAASVDGKTHRLDQQQVLAPTAVTALNLRRHFERAEHRAEFVRAVETAGAPQGSPGWRASQNERVLGYRDGAWYSATVHELDDDVVYVKWRGDGRVAELAPQHVVPEPPYQPGPCRGGYALARPASAAEPWQPVRVEGVREDVIAVVDVDGKRRSLPARDLVPLR
jgi:hypothetical protein